MSRHSPVTNEEGNPLGSQNDLLLEEQVRPAKGPEIVDENALALLFAEHGWTEPRPYYFHNLNDLSRYPSPFAGVSKSKESLSNDDSHDAVLQTWLGFHSKSPPEITPTFKNGLSPYLGFICQAEADSSGGSETAEVQYQSCQAGENVWEFSLNHFISPSKQTDSFKKRTFQIRRQQRIPDLFTGSLRSTERQEEFFLVNQNCESLTVNRGSSTFGRGAVVGPLFSFATIEIDSVVLLWWREAKALKYAPRAVEVLTGSSSRSSRSSSQTSTPSKKRKSRNDENSGSGQGDDSSGDSGKGGDSVVSSSRSGSSKRLKGSDASTHHVAAGTGSLPSAQLSPPVPQPEPQSQPKPQPPSSPKSWQEIFDKGMMRHRACRERNLKEWDEYTEKYNVKFETLEELYDTMPLIAIGTFWEGLNLKKRHFAYGGFDVFALGHGIPGDSQMTYHGIVGAPNDLILPVFIHADKDLPTEEGGKTGVKGHFAFVCARWNKEEGKIELRLWNSLGDAWNAELYEAAQQIILASKWPYDQTRDQVPERNFKKGGDLLMKCPDQEGENTCGFYMILNAWCIMLGIPIEPASERRSNPKNYKSFHATGLEVLNLAMMGCMDAVTVQAFLNIEGYSEEQSPDSLVQNMQSVKMNNESLTDTVNKMHKSKYEEAGKTWQDFDSEKLARDLGRAPGISVDQIMEEDMEKAIQISIEEEIRRRNSSKDRENPPGRT